jgi:hypothetical protein
MSYIDRDLYTLFAQCAAAGLPLSTALFADGLASKYELLALLRGQLRDWLHKCGAGDAPQGEASA